MRDLPDLIADSEQLDDLLSLPTAEVVELFRVLPGDIVLLGVAGKIGATLAWMAKRAAEAAGDRRRIIGVARFTAQASREWLEKRGIETIACDLLDAGVVARLPDAPHVIYLAGRKFGTSGDEAATWAANAVIPTRICDRYRDSAIVAFSTGCVYPLVTAESGGCSEETPPQPVGEYAQSCLARERIFEHFSRRHGQRICILRLNYAVEMRYGVLHDIARRVWNDMEVDLRAPNVNVIWQGDVNAWTLRAMGHCAAPPLVLNITGPEMLSVEALACAFADKFRKTARFGRRGQIGYLSNAARAIRLFGYPRVAPARLIEWTADWIAAGKPSLDAPTHFETQTGVF